MKKTTSQVEFDLAIHGWSFCNSRMLRGRIQQAESIVARLLPNDPRHDTLTAMRDALSKQEA